MMKLLAILSVAIISAISVAPMAAQGAAQQQQQRQGQGRLGRQAQQAPGIAEDPGVTPNEIQRMFDAYALVQAQDQLGLSDDQYGRFLVRFKTLQDIRRKALQEHTRLVMELRRLLMQGQPDEPQLKERMQALQDVDSRAVADVRKAYEAIDQALDVKQQASFRVFEEQMERRKIELITRARQANRPKQQQ
ncbi:MAG TPA: hypothetical protein VGJ39_00645 [Vicinamibacterales bacterium]